MISVSVVRRASSRIPALLPALLVLCATTANAQTQPVAGDDGPFSVNEGGSLGGSPSVLANDSDADPGDVLTVGVLTPPAFDAAFSLNPTTGVITYTHDGSETTSDSFTYEACDDEVPQQCDSATVTFTINPVNDDPIANNDTATVDEDTTNNPIDVTGNDTDAEGDTLTVSSASTATGSVSPSGGDVLYTPPANFTGQATVNYTISDGNGGSDSAVLTVTVDNVNDPPVAVDDTATVAEDSSNNVINVTGNDTDIDGDTLSVSAASTGTGSVTFGGTNVVYTPPPNFSGQAIVNYTVSDGNGGSDGGVLTVTVSNLNDPPVANPDTLTVNEDTTNNPVNVTANDTDPDGDTLSVTQASAGNGSVSVLGNSTVRYSPDPDYFGADTISYTISDGNGGTDSSTVSVTVSPVPDPPVANNDTASVAEDSTNNIINVTANDTDPDGDTLTVTAASTATGTVTPSGGNVSYTPPANFSGQATINYTINDGTGRTDSATVTVTVTSENDPPVANNDTATVEEDSSNNLINVAANDTDPDDDPLTVSAASTATGAVTFSGGNVSYTPPADFNGQATINYTISDGNGGTDTAIVTVTVTNVNDPPVANDDTATVEEDSSNNVINVTANDTDVDDDTLTVTAASTATGTVTFGGGNVSYTPPANFSGTATINYTISDGQGGTDSATVTVTVTDENDPPVANDDTATVQEDSSNNVIDVAANDTDPDGDPLEVSAASTATGTVTFSGGNVSYTPPADFNGQATINYTISDGNGGTDSAVVTVTVESVNDAPVFIGVVPPGLSTPEDTTLTIPVSALNIDDPDSDQSTFVLTLDPVLPPGANYTLAGPASITPAENFNGDLSVRATVSDGLDDSAPFLIPVTVTAENDAPVLDAEIGPQTAIERSLFTLDVSGNFSDADVGDTLTFSAIGLPASGRIAIDSVSGIISGTPTVEDARDNDPYIVTVTAQDPSGASVSDEFDLIVSALDRANVGLTIGVSPESGLPNDQLQWTFTAANQGPAPGENVELTGSFFGDGLSVAAGGGSNCSITLQAGRADFACTIGALPTDGTASVSLTTTASQATEVVAFGTAAGAQAVPIDPNTADNSAVRAVGVAESFSDGAVQFLGSSTVRSVAAGDFNGDGRTDIVVGTAAGQPVQIYLGDDPRESCGCQRDFVSTPVSIPDTGSNQGIAVADFDNDGNLDIVIANGGGQPDAVYRNTGSANFVLSALLEETNGRDVAVGDFNNDGNMDIAIAATSPNPVYLGDGNGGFGAAIMLGDDESFDVAAGRFDNDLFDDLVFANVGSDSQVWLSNGAGDFSPGQLLQFGDAISVAASDLNADGLDDVVLGRIPSAPNDIPENPVLLNQGGGSFGAPFALLGISPTNDVLIGDVSDDGIPDIVFVNSSGMHQTWVADGSGYTLHSEQIIDIGATGGVLADLGFADTGDPGGLDLALGGQASAGLGVYLNDSNGNLGLGDAVAPVIALNGASSVDVPSGTVYSDAGADATDNIDGDISSSIVVSNPVNTAVVGTYTVTYNVEDRAGNDAVQVTRTVNVTAATGRGGGGGGAFGFWAIALLFGVYLAASARRKGQMI